MSHDRFCERLNVLRRDIGTTVEQCLSLAAEHEVLTGSQTGTPGDQFVDKVGRSFLTGARRRCQPNGVADHFIGDWDSLYDLMKLPHRLFREQRFDRRKGSGCRLLHHCDFFVFRQIINQHIEHEAIELRFRQRICAFHFDWVLSRQNKERFIERIPAAGGCHLMLTHGFQKCRLSFWRRAIDFVSQQYVGKNRAGDEPHGASATFIFFQYFGARDVRRHQVGSELNPAEFQIKQLSDRLHQQRLGQPRCSCDQTVASGEQRHQQLPDDVFLSDDDSREFGINLFPHLPQLADKFSFTIRSEVSCCFGHI